MKGIPTLISSPSPLTSASVTAMLCGSIEGGWVGLTCNLLYNSNSEGGWVWFCEWSRFASTSQVPQPKVFFQWARRRGRRGTIFPGFFLLGPLPFNRCTFWLFSFELCLWIKNQALTSLDKISRGNVPFFPSRAEELNFHFSICSRLCSPLEF